MIDVATAGDRQEPHDALRAPMVAFDADIAAELAFGGTRIPLPTVPFLPIEPLRASRHGWRDVAGRPLAPTSFGPM
jgi:hypothetical protein